MGLACLFRAPNSSPFLSAQNAFVILHSVLIQMGGEGQERGGGDTPKKNEKKRKLLVKSCKRASKTVRNLQ